MSLASARAYTEARRLYRSALAVQDEPVWIAKLIACVSSVQRLICDNGRGGKNRDQVVTTRIFS